MLTGVVLALWATLLLAEDTPMGGFLSRWLCERPAAWLNRRTWPQLLIAVTLIGLVALVLWHGAAEGMQVFGLAMPDTAAWFTTFEVDTWLDMVAALGVAAAAMRLKGGRALLDGWLARRTMRRPVRRAARPRATRACRLPSPANDDVDRGSLVLAS